MSMPVIDIVALFIGREDREGDNGSGDATEDDDDTDVEAGGYARLGRAFWEEEDDNEDRDEQGRRARRRRRKPVEVRDALQGGAVVVVVHGSPEATIISDDRGEGKRGGSFADKRSRTGRKRGRQQNGACVSDDNDERLTYIQRRDDAYNNITFNKKHIISLKFFN
jgi:hypothetical protein